MKMISVVSACFNEEENVRELIDRVREVFTGLPQYAYEHIFIDNHSSDGTVDILRGIAASDSRVRVIVNQRNFGHIRSPFHGLLQARGEAVLSLTSDLQDPPEMIPMFLAKWEEGYKVVVGIKSGSEEPSLVFALRKAYYSVITRLSDIELVRNFTGFGLYDQQVIMQLRLIDDPYPYFRGLICDLGYQRAEVFYHQPVRKRGKTKNGFYTLFDMAMLGITNHTKVPLRLATMAGFLLAFLSLAVAVGYFVYKLFMWDSFQLGMAPIVIGLFFFSSVQLMFIGVLGEYIGAIHTQVLKRPRVVERERVNFPDESTGGKSA